MQARRVASRANACAGVGSSFTRTTSFTPRTLTTHRGAPRGERNSNIRRAAILPPNRTRHLLVTALSLSATGNALLVAFLHPGIGAAQLAAPLALIGIANGLAMGLVDGQAMSMVDQSRIGMASGLLSTVRAGSNSLMLAVFGAALIGLLGTRLGDGKLAADVAAGKLEGARQAVLAAEFTYAWKLALAVVAVVMTGAALLVRWMLRPVPEPIDAQPLTPQSLTTQPLTTRPLDSRPLAARPLDAEPLTVPAAPRPAAAGAPLAGTRPAHRG
ncbi:hypothetical protein ACH4SP_17595 [Streptomyces sp. NPDC021093]|uniref:hypothetical protein n=1 Tax=Streptomyces sp. NPDC021093 TaxID=3365112 RepID=UPI00378CB10D